MTILRMTILRHRPRWLCALTGHRWEQVARQVADPYGGGGRLVYAYHICWRCMAEQRRSHD